MFTFGLNSSGQLGLGHRENKNVPCYVSTLNTLRVTSVSAGGAFGKGVLCIVTGFPDILLIINISDNHKLYVCGTCELLGLGENVKEDQLIPTEVSTFAGKKVFNVQSGWLFSLCLVIETGTVYYIKWEVVHISITENNLPTYYIRLNFAFNSTSDSVKNKMQVWGNPELGYFGNLSNDIIYEVNAKIPVLISQIFAHLNAKDLARVGMTNTVMNVLSEHNLLWKKCYLKDWGPGNSDLVYAKILRKF